MRLLIVEDNSDLSKALSRGFREEGFAVACALDGNEGLHQARSGEYDLIVLDLMLPGMSGFRILETIRAEGHRVPVIFLTARSEVEDRVRGLRLGGDDYLTKPFSFEELLARVRAVLRRSSGAAQDSIVWSELMLEPEEHSVQWGDTPLDLTPKEFGLLVYLTAKPNVVYKREDIIRDIWGRPSGGDLRTVDTHIKRLRRKIEETRAVPWSIATVWGVGYKFQINE